MIIYPAIDLLDGKCVRLHKGDFDRQTVYDGVPAEVAQKYKTDGATWLHLVDLDGARDPAKRQTTLIHDIIAASGLKVQTGGGVRSAADVETLLNAGASRVVIGSMAVKDTEMTVACIKRFGTEKICLAMDVASEGEKYKIAVSGWKEESGVALDNLIEYYLAAGLRHMLCTDIARDGTMTGCNAALYSVLHRKFPGLQVQASGGVSALDDLRGLEAAGVIIGKALYEGKFTVKQALEAAC